MLIALSFLCISLRELICISSCSFWLINDSIFSHICMIASQLSSLYQRNISTPASHMTASLPFLADVASLFAIFQPRLCCSYFRPLTQPYFAIFHFFTFLKYFSAYHMYTSQISTAFESEATGICHFCREDEDIEKWQHRVSLYNAK